MEHLLVNNELNELSEKVELISRKRLTEDLTNKNSILNGEKYFSREYGSQNFLTFQPVLVYFIPTTNDMVMVWKSKGLSDKSTKSPSTTGNSPVPTLKHLYNSQFLIEFNDRCLKPDRVTFTSKK